MIGVNSQIETGGAGRGNVGVGFAVPSNIVQATSTADLERDGRVRRAYIGVATTPPRTGTGARISSIVPGGPAARAGLHTGDVITRIGAAQVAGAGDVSAGGLRRAARRSGCASSTAAPGRTRDAGRPPRAAARPSRRPEADGR